MAGFLKAEGKLFSDEEEVVVVDFDFFRLVGKGSVKGVSDLPEPFVRGIINPYLFFFLHCFFLYL